MSELPKLWKHQEEVIHRVKLLVENGIRYFALFHSVGTGKTRTMLEILRNIFNSRQKILRTLVVSPLIVTRNWESEIAKYTKIPRDRYCRLEGTVAERAKVLSSCEGIAITNYDSFANPVFLKAVLQWKPEILILDEAHYCKAFSTKRTKAIHKVAESMGESGFRYIMTGTPIANSQQDIWSLAYILDLGKTFGKSFYAFRNAFFRNVNSNKSHLNFPLWVPRPGGDDVIRNKIKSFSSVVDKEECIDLPPLIRQRIHVDLTPEQARVYKEMKKNLITMINGKAAVAQIALTKALRLQQIVSGFLNMDDGTTKQLPSNRQKVLSELLDLIPKGKKVIIWAVFHNDYQIIADVLRARKSNFREAHGLVPEKQKMENIDFFKSSSDCDYLIGSPAAIGIGINIVEAQYSIWWSRNFSMIQDEQAAARNYRGGSDIHEHITRYDLVADGTIDSLVLEAVEGKFKLAEKILSLTDSDI